MADEKKDTKGEEKQAEAAAAAPAGKSKKKLFMIIGGVVLLLLAIGTPLAYFMLAGQKKEGAEQLDQSAVEGEGDIASLEGAQDEDELQEGEAALGVIFPLDSFVVNLQGGRYLRCQMQLEFEGRDVPQRFYARLVPVRDALIKLLASRNADDTVSEAGREQIKKDAREAINLILKREEVKNVYFTQFVVQ